MLGDKGDGGVITVSHEYGTTRKGKVLEIVGRTQFVADDHGEGHILMAGSGDESARIGDSGSLIFTKGGPTGGYWKFTKDND